MIDPTLKTIFRFYDSVVKQNYQKSYILNDVSSFELITPKDVFLPFQIKRSKNPDDTINIYLVNINTNTTTDITSLIDSADIELVTTSDFDYIIYYGSKKLISNTECGRYYLKVSDNKKSWYSEIITIGDLETFASNPLEQDIYPVKLNDEDEILEYLTEELIIYKT